MARGFAGLAGFAPIIYAALGVMLIVELGLTAFIVDRTDGFWSSPPSQFSFMLFATVWSILVLAYVALTPRFFARAFHGLAAVILLILTTLFWFAGSIAMAALLGLPRCRGSFCTTTRTAQAATAFGFFIWAAFAVLAALDGMANLRGGARADTTSSKQQQQPVAA
ncbi:hypothetical protein GQ602_000047 [Ophiocordyceps camponoti-floridani]|uniref:MARVEL domain-containing protein n=1 Tax=Ophiocordyceps camponoti-floridani TaxID=2030778 RepID=A0A8H4VFW1_9HYPO|nr:hypothetical protein GQ602_000047 [Ophiocordyceps camponoti-floridani]